MHTGCNRKVTGIIKINDKDVMKAVKAKKYELCSVCNPPK